MGGVGRGSFVTRLQLHDWEITLVGRHWSKWPEGDRKIARENCREACGAGVSGEEGSGR